MPDEKTQPPNLTPPPTTSPAPDSIDDGTHPGWAPGAYQRFVASRDEVKALRERLAVVEPELAAARTQADTLRATYEQDLAMARLGGNFGHPSVRRAIRREYADYRGDAGDAALGFPEWLESDDARQNPLISAHFPAAGAAQPKPAQPPDVNAGTGEAPRAATTTYDAATIARLRAAGQLDSHLPAAVEEMAAAGEIILSPELKRMLGIG